MNKKWFTLMPRALFARYCRIIPVALLLLLLYIRTCTGVATGTCTGHDNCSCCWSLSFNLICWRWVSWLLDTFSSRTFTRDAQICMSSSFWRTMLMALSFGISPSLGCSGQSKHPQSRACFHSLSQIQTHSLHSRILVAEQNGAQTRRRCMP